MTVNKGVRMIENALYLEKEKTIIVSDLHIGLESSLHNKGVLIPKTQRKELVLAFDKALEAKPTTIVLNGDLKHDFGTISSQEWEDILFFIDYLKKKTQVIVIEGNHDPLLDKVAAKRGLPIHQSWTAGSFFICHGDILLPIPKQARTIIIGHVHPATSITDGVRTEKYKCFLIGKYKGKDLIVLPSFNPLLIGSEDYSLSPYVKGKVKKVVIGQAGEGYAFL
jgi:putative SbcD/Mre11-related phosphoesterase